MAKYDPLQEYLAALPAGAREITLSFTQLEQIIGTSLPASARHYREWWANETRPTSHVQALAWMEAGWAVVTVNQSQDWVRFRRANVRPR